MENGTTVLGSRVKCAISGFTGIATGRLEYINGCFQILIHPPVNDKGEDQKSIWIDECQVDLVDLAAVPHWGAPVLPQLGAPKVGGPPQEDWR